ncbi:uncharacterized protein LOC144010111 [Festucalex cinctus]
MNPRQVSAVFYSHSENISTALIWSGSTDVDKYSNVLLGDEHSSLPLDCISSVINQTLKKDVLHNCVKDNKSPSTPTDLLHRLDHLDCKLTPFAKASRWPVLIEFSPSLPCHCMPRCMFHILATAVLPRGWKAKAYPPDKQNSTD